MENVFLAYFELLKNPLSHSLDATAYPGIVAGHVWNPGQQKLLLRRIYMQVM